MMHADWNCSSVLSTGFSSASFSAVYGIIASICLFIQWFHILILGRRSEGLSNIAKGYLEYMVHVMSYTYIMTDKRPDILPVVVKIYEE